MGSVDDAGADGVGGRVSCRLLIREGVKFDAFSEVRRCLTRPLVMQLCTSFVVGAEASATEVAQCVM